MELEVTDKEEDHKEELGGSDSVEREVQEGRHRESKDKVIKPKTVSYNSEPG